MPSLDHIGYPMVCFCDIPISRLSEHTTFYGEYGLGLTKEWGLKNGLEPVIYSTRAGIATRVFECLDKLTDADIGEHGDEVLRIWNDLLPRIKPLNGKMVIGGEFVDKEFYQENEWRYVPDAFHMAFEDKDEFERKRAQYNEEVRGYTLGLTPSDVVYIFVKNENEIPVVFDFIQNQMGQFPLNDIKILSSRITSLEALSRDL